MINNKNSAEQALKLISLLTLIIFILLFFFRPVEVGDIWWHLKTGEWIKENQAIPYTNPIPYSEDENLLFTQPIAQWLGSSIYYDVYLLGGFLGLKIFRAFFFFLILSIFFFYARKKIPYYLLLIIIFFMAFGFANRCILRPFVFNFLFLQIFLIILFSYRKNPSFKKLLWILPAGTIWSNLHLGSFVYGSLFISIFLGASIIEWINSFLQSKNNDRSPIKTQTKHLFYILILFWISFIVNPAGIDALTYPWKVFLFPQFIGFYSLNATIIELSAPFYAFSLTAFWFYGLLFLAVLSLISNEKKDFLLTILLTFSIFFFFYAIRGSGFFIIGSTFVIAQSFKNASFCKKWNTFKFSKYLNTAIALVLILIFVRQSLLIINRKNYKNNQKTSWLTAELYPSNPNTAIDFLNQHKIFGSIFHTDDIGDYIIWSSYPDLKSFYDGRQISQERGRLYQLILGDPEKNWKSAEQKYNFKIVAIKINGEYKAHFANFLIADPTWQFIFLDGDDAIFVKRNYFDLPKAALKFEDALKGERASLDDFETLDQIVATPDKEKSAFQENIGYIDLIYEASVLFDLGYQGAAIKRIIKAFEADPGNPIIRGVASLFVADILQRIKGQNNI